MNSSYVIIGSEALRDHFPDYPDEPKDVDVVLEHTTFIDFAPTTRPIELHHVDWNLFSHFRKHSNGRSVMSVDGLYTLKVSHVPWEGKNGKWWKHMKDIAFLKRKGAKLIPEFHKVLLEHWKKVHGDKSEITFAKKNYEFFTENVERKYDHDWLHTYFMIQDVPAYQRILVSPDSALCSEEKFNALSNDQKFHTILEEIFVLSTERGTSFNEMYKRIVTKMSKGFWNTFIIENVSAILDGFKIEKAVFLSKKNQLN